MASADVSTRRECTASAVTHAVWLQVATLASLVLLLGSFVHAVRRANARARAEALEADDGDEQLPEGSGVAPVAAVAQPPGLGSSRRLQVRCIRPTI